MLPVGAWLAWLVWNLWNSLALQRNSLALERLTVFGNIFWGLYCCCLLAVVSHYGQEPM